MKPHIFNPIRTILVILTLMSNWSIANAASITVPDNNVLTQNTGSLVLVVTQTGVPDGFLQPYAVQWDCGTFGTGDQLITSGNSFTISSIPSGTSCTISEPTGPLQVPPPPGYYLSAPTFSPSATVTIPPDNGSTTTVTITNTLNPNMGILFLISTVTGGPPNFQGAYGFHIDCGPGSVIDFPPFPSGGPTGPGMRTNPIPSGTSCTVSEPTLPVPPSGYTYGTPTFSPSDTVTIPPNNGSSITVTVNNVLTQNTGSLVLDVVQTGGPDGFLQPYAVQWDCGTFGTGDQLITSGNSFTISGIPSGTSCTISEPTGPLQVPPPPGYYLSAPTFSPSATVTIPPDNGSTTTVTITNTLDPNTGTLLLASTVTGGPSYFPGNFTIHFDCGPEFIADIPVFSGAPPMPSNPIPGGTSCTVSEPTLPSPPPGYSFGTPTFSPSDTVTIPPNNGSSITVTINNVLTQNTGSLVLDVTQTGGPDGYLLPYTVYWDCGSFGTGPQAILPGNSFTISNIPSGTSCTVSEPASLLQPIPPTGYYQGLPTFSPSATVTIPPDNGSTTTVTIANTFNLNMGTLLLASTVTGGPPYFPGNFTIHFDCGPEFIADIPVFSGAPPMPSNPIPGGTSCTISEPTLPSPPPGYSYGTPTFSPSDTVTIPPNNGSSITVTINNVLTQNTGSLVLDVTQTGGPDGFLQPYAVQWDCGTFGTGDQLITSGNSFTISSIPSGTSCTISEPTGPLQVPPPPGYYLSAPTFSPAATVTIPPDNGSTTTVTITNTLNPNTGTLLLASTITGGPSNFQSIFTIHFDCGPGFIADIPVFSGGPPMPSNPIPGGTSCTVSEPTLSSPPSGYSFGTPTFSPSATVTIPPYNGSSITVTVNNVLIQNAVGSLKITKTITGSSFSGLINVNVVCSGGGTYASSITYPTPGYITINNIPAGNTCIVTEPTFPTPPAGYAWGTPSISGSPATISQGAVAGVTVANILQTGHAQVVKAVNGKPITAANNCTDISGNITGCTFQLRQNASTTAVGTILETLSTLTGGVSKGTLNFTTLLTPGSTYQMCEIIMPGWLTGLGSLVPNSFLPPNGTAPNPAVDNSIQCSSFTAHPDTATAGNVFKINNTPPPVVLSLTISFWTNWASCAISNSGLKPILDETLAKAQPNGVVVSAGSKTYPVFGPPFYLVLNGSITTKQKAPDCSKAINLLNKTTIDGKKVMTGDPAFNLAAQMVAAELNYVVGSGRKAAVTTAIQQSVLLLGKYKFNGLTHTTISTADAATMNKLATALDNYNNNRP